MRELFTLNAEGQGEYTKLFEVGKENVTWYNHHQGKQKNALTFTYSTEYAT